MSFVLTTASTVTCTHPAPGPVTLAGTAKLRVDGAPVLRAADVVGAPVTCAAPVTQSSQPCKQVIAVTVGAASKLAVGGLPVLTDSLAGVTNGVKPPPPTPAGLSAAAAQTRLSVE